MQRLLSAITATIVIFSFGAAAQASNSAKVPHVSGISANGINAKFRPSSYALKVHVTGQEVAALSIEPEQAIRLSQNIKVLDQSNQPVAATVSIKGKTATIAFAQPVKPDTTLRVEMYGIQNPNLMPTAQFSINTQLAGFNSEISLGTVQVATHYGRL